MYKIVYATSELLYEAINEVEEKVKQLKSEGWVEQGGISISLTVYYTVAQAMVKK